MYRKLTSFARITTLLIATTACQENFNSESSPQGTKKKAIVFSAENLPITYHPGAITGTTNNPGGPQTWTPVSIPKGTHFAKDYHISIEAELNGVDENGKVVPLPEMNRILFYMFAPDIGAFLLNTKDLKPTSKVKYIVSAKDSSLLKIALKKINAPEFGGTLSFSALTLTNVDKPFNITIKKVKVDTGVKK